MMIQRTKAGMIWSGDDLLSPMGRLTTELWDDYCEALQEWQFWRKAALGEFWEEAEEEIKGDD